MPTDRDTLVIRPHATKTPGILGQLSLPRACLCFGINMARKSLRSTKAPTPCHNSDVFYRIGHTCFSWFSVGFSKTTYIQTINVIFPAKKLRFLGFHVIYSRWSCFVSIFPRAGQCCGFFRVFIFNIIYFSWLASKSHWFFLDNRCTVLKRREKRVLSVLPPP